jgi:hypothetical protein
MLSIVKAIKNSINSVNYSVNDGKNAVNVCNNLLRV